MPDRFAMARIARAFAVVAKFWIWSTGASKAPFTVVWPGKSSINWERPGQVIANSAVVAVDPSALFRVRASFATDVIIDVVGYYR